MRFILTGITQDLGFRVFAFARVEASAVRNTCTIRVDLGLIRKYDIPMQELPLLCRNLLEHRDAGEETPPTLTFTEEEMLLYAKDRAATRLAAAQRKRPPRRPPSENVGGAWRGHNRSGIAPAHTLPSTTRDPEA